LFKAGAPLRLTREHSIDLVAPDGTLFGARESLFKINVTTGKTTLIGSGGYSDIRGIAFIKGHSQPAPSKKKPVKKRGPK
jgi:hypothetical protein